MTGLVRWLIRVGNFSPSGVPEGDPQHRPRRDARVDVCR